METRAVQKRALCTTLCTLAHAHYTLNLVTFSFTTKTSGSEKSKTVQNYKPNRINIKN